MEFMKWYTNKATFPEVSFMRIAVSKVIVRVRQSDHFEVIDLSSEEIRIIAKNCS